MENKVLAKVGDKEITEEVVGKFLNDLGPQVAMQFNTPDGKRRVVEELVNQELSYLDALEKGLDKDEEFIKQYEMMKEGLLKQYAIGRLLEDLEVSDQEAKDYYEGHPEFFAKPETINASHILVDSLDKAEKVKQEIEEGKDFAAAAQEYSSCPSNQAGGNLGDFQKGQMVPEFDEKAFDLAIGEVSEPVKTQFGYHLILVNGKNEASTASFDEVKENLKTQLLAVKQQERYVEATNKLKEKYPVEINM